MTKQEYTLDNDWVMARERLRELEKNLILPQFDTWKELGYPRDGNVSKSVRGEDR